VDPVTCARVVEEVARHDSAAAWALQAGNTGGWWCSRMSQAAVDAVHAGGPDVIIAASFSPPHRAVPVDGGYRFTGRGPLASNVRDAAWVMMTGLVFDGDAPRMTPHGPEMVALMMPARDVEVVETWRSLGMRGTDSNDVVASDLFVPAAMAFHLAPDFAPPAQYHGPLYRFPAIGSVIAVVAPIALAVARAAIDEVRALAARKTPMGSTRLMRDRVAVQVAVADAEATLRSARALFYETMATVWQRTIAGRPTLEERADLLLAGAHAVRGALRAVDLMHGAAGTTGIYERSPLERHFRDAHTLRHHGFVAESRLEAVGQVYLGVAPEFGLVAL
jgi:alkylation response protein AidB-like acyl-CoA dehydrogenase